jgi:aconitate hydratase
MLPFTIGKDAMANLAVGDLIHIPGIRRKIQNGAESAPALMIRERGRTPLELKFEGLSREDREIILAGCLMNYYAG